MLYLTCTTLANVDLAHYGVSRAKDRVSVHGGTSLIFQYIRTIDVHGCNTNWLICAFNRCSTFYKSLSTKNLLEK